ncbi:MAG: hypothetical protein KGQ37_07135 [Hyphomicrobiales bacterium]|nr:hypothetical protein [Hyphomicrobiales bacterium]
MIGMGANLPAASAAFMAATVEAVEAFTIILAVSVVRGPRPALLGAGAALALLGALVLALGPLLALVPLHLVQAIVGALQLLFGLRWLRKAMLRALGIIALHDETAAYQKTTAALGRDAALAGRAADWVAGLAAFKAMALEGLEVVFIVLAVGAAGGTALLAASLGAGLACLMVLAIGLMLRVPLARVPENALKYGVGIMLSAFGLFWLVEGMGGIWPGGDLAILALMAGFFGASLLLRAVLRPAAKATMRPRS